MSNRNNENFSYWRFFPFATGVIDTGGAPWFANIYANFRKNVNVSYSLIRGLGETDPCKKPEVEKKSHGNVPLNHAAFALEDRIFIKPFIFFVLFDRLLVCRVWCELFEAVENGDRNREGDCGGEGGLNTDQRSVIHSFCYNLRWMLWLRYGHFKGAQSWKICGRDFYTKQICMDRWIRN